MPKVKGIFQLGEEYQQHADIFKEILKSKWASSTYIASAYLQYNGVVAIENALKSAPNKVAFIGINNGVTSIQGILELLKTKCQIITVNMGSAPALFHSKLCCVKSDNRAKIWLGSANLTHSGLHNNLETGFLLDLDLTVKDEDKALDNILSPLLSLKSNYPHHVLAINHENKAKRLLIEGLLRDESQRRQSKPSEGDSKATIGKPAIEVPFSPPPPKPASIQTKSKPGAKKQKADVKGEVQPTSKLVWRKQKLSRRDIQLPQPSGTNPTGALSLTQSQFKVDNKIIDQTTYFRRVVFKGLDWYKIKSGKEMASAKFQIYIDNKYLGEFELQLSHNPAWESGQANYTTAIHWGPVTPYIKKEAHLNKQLELYSTPDKEVFTLKIS